MNPHMKSEMKSINAVQLSMYIGITIMLAGRGISYSNGGVENNAAMISNDVTALEAKACGAPAHLEGKVDIPRSAGINSICIVGDEYYSTAFRRIGVDAAIRSSIVHDGKLYIGGDFQHVADIAANRIACWDGQSWREIGGGVSFPEIPDFCHVYAMTFYEDQLILGGSFTLAGGFEVSHVASWDGQNWSNLGGGVNHYVRSLIVHEGRLIAGGIFWEAGGIEASKIAAWNGMQWEAMGAGLGGFWVVALEEYGGFLYAGGDFSNGLARWSGEEWVHEFQGGLCCGDGGYAIANALLATDAGLVVGGMFHEAGPIVAHNIAVWNGSEWSDMNSGLYGEFNGNWSEVYAVQEYHGDLYAGGIYQEAGEPGIITNCIARWDGEAWNAMGGGITDRCYTLCVHQDTLLVCGAYRTFNGTEGRGMAKWDGSIWHQFQPMGNGLNSPAYCQHTYNGELVMAGDFTRAGNVAAQNIASYDGTSWHPLGSGLASGPVWKPYKAMIEYDSQLIVAGAIETAGGITVHNIAKWNGSLWGRLGNGFGDIVHALVIHDGSLYAEGSRWVPTQNTWIEDIPTDGQIMALLSHEGDLIVAGDFDRICDLDTKNIARWDGERAYPYGEGLEDGYDMGEVLTLAIYRGELYAGGGFRANGGSFIAKWDGHDWQAVGGGAGTAVLALENVGRVLVAGGYFLLAGGMRANHIAYWNGISWNMMGSGLEGASIYQRAVYDLGLYNGSLFICGDFTLAGTRPSWFIASWLDPSIVVRMDEYEALRIGSSVTIKWSCDQVTEPIVYSIWRQEQGRPREIIVDGLTCWEMGGEYSDPDPPVGAVDYWLRALYGSGQETWFGPMHVAAQSNDQPPHPILLTSYPNPMNPLTHIEYRLPESSSVRLGIYDLEGRLVTILVDRRQGPGLQSITWDGQTDAGIRAASGTYLVRLETERIVETDKIVIVK
jgi:hypothetical protein